MNTHQHAEPVAPSNTNRRRTRSAIAASAGVVIGSIGLIGFAGGNASAIVDGEQTTIEANPWQVALTAPSGEQFCGGSIVSDRVIVTAAHCTLGIDASGMNIRAGVTDLSSDAGQVRGISSVIEHPTYDGGVGDIAMLVLDQPLELNDSVRAVALATADDIVAGSSARVTGWGATGEFAEDSPDVLRGADVPLVSDADCALVQEGNDDELCAGGTGTDSCYGDSGGPLTVATDEGQKLAGVVSWGDACGGAKGGVYAEVPTFAEWVADRVDDPDAPAPDRLPVPEYDDFLDDEFSDEDYGEPIDIDDDFVDSVGGFDALDAMTDEEFWDAYDEWMATNGDDASGDADDGFDEAGDEWDDFEDSFGDEATDEWEVGGSDTNGDDIVQWSEITEEGEADEYDLNGDGIVNWSELVDA